MYVSAIQCYGNICNTKQSKQNVKEGGKVFPRKQHFKHLSLGKNFYYFRRRVTFYIII